MSRKILIVEDDSSTAAYLAKGLSEAGYAVEAAHDGRDGLFLASEGIFDLVIADRMLPGLDGLSMVSAIRAAGIATPVLVLSALAAVDDRVDGLKAGADDYLCKPFSFAELSARIEALVRRSDRAATEPAKTRLAVGDLEIDLLARAVTRAGRSIPLGAREFNLLEFLARHAGQVVTRTMMLEKIWNYHFDPGSNVVDVHIGRLRRKLEDGFASPILHTVRGAGYRLAADPSDPPAVRVSHLRQPWLGRFVRLSVTARIALLSIALALVSNLVLVGFVWKRTDAAVIGTVRRETIEQSDAMVEIYKVGGLTEVVEAIGHARLAGDTALLLAVLDERGRRISGFAPDRIAVPLGPTPFRIADIDGSAATADIGYTLRPIGRHWLLTGRRLDLVEAERHAIEGALAVAVLLSLVLGVGAGLVLARYVGRRLNRIAAVIAAAGEGDLSRRVPVAPTRRDAFDGLADQLNLMLGRLERLMVELRVVTDSLAHDLRSPLARLRTKTEQAVLIADPAAREAALGGLLVETDLVMRMLTMVIEISRSESVSRARFILVEPAELVEEIAELYEPVAEEAGLDFTIAIDASAPPMLLHRELLSQAITNLIDNALKHAANGGVLTLRLVVHAQEIAIQVEDRGAGIAESDRAQALKRFGRLDAARTTPGAGLGMTLIEAVARLHNGRFELADNVPGLVARIVLPV